MRWWDWWLLGQLAVGCVVVGVMGFYEDRPRDMPAWMPLFAESRWSLGLAVLAAPEILILVLATKIGKRLSRPFGR